MKLRLQVDGSISVVHNVGNKDYILRGSHKVNDGTYHTVRFLRSDNNSTLQVDDHSAVYRFYAGKKPLVAYLMLPVELLSTQSQLKIIIKICMILC